MSHLQVRRDKLQQSLKATDADSMLVTNVNNVRYLTGFSGDSSYVVVQGNRWILVSDDRYAEQIAEECPGLEVVIRPHNQTTPEAACEVLNKLGAKRIILEADTVTLGMQAMFAKYTKTAAWLPVSGLVENLRMVKDAVETQILRDAIRIAEKAYGMFLPMLQGSDSEKDLGDRMEMFVRRAGGECSSFTPICAVGERSALPHATATGKLLKTSTKLLVDWGATYQGYRSDLTRTMRFESAEATSEKERSYLNFEEIFGYVQQAQNAALAAVRDGVPCKEVDIAARKVFSSAKVRGHSNLNLDKHFTHGLGHGIGLDIHEGPRVRSNSDDVLRTGMIITLEPAVYFSGWGGIRIEDDILVTPDGGVRLSSLPQVPDLSL